MAKKCMNCNRVFGDEMLYCPECGTRLLDKPEDTGKEEPSKHPEEKTNKERTWVWILLIIVACVWAFIMTALYADANNAYAAASSSRDFYYDEYKQWERKAGELQDQVDFMDKYLVLIFDDGSNYYHTYQCYQKYNESFFAYNISTAEAKGYLPCPDCH